MPFDNPRQPETESRSVPTITPKPDPNVFHRAADAIRAYGWRPDAPLGEPGVEPVCLMEALSIAAHVPWKLDDENRADYLDYKAIGDTPEAQFLAEYLLDHKYWNPNSRFYIMGTSHELYDWNDHECQGEEHCIAILEEAADALM